MIYSRTNKYGFMLLSTCLVLGCGSGGGDSIGIREDTKTTTAAVIYPPTIIGVLALGGLSNLCWDIPSWQVYAGQELQIWNCNNGANQAFGYIGNEILSSSVLGSQFCLDGGSSYTSAVSWQTCNGSAAQRWSIDQGIVQNQGTGGLLSVPQGAQAGQRVGYEQGAQQLGDTWWPFGSFRGGTLQNQLNAWENGGQPMCLDDTGNNKNGGPFTIVEDSTCNGSGEQLFTLTENNQVMVNGLCLDVYQGNGANGWVSLETCNGSTEQSWYMYGAIGVPTQMRSATSGIFGGTAYCLTINGASTTSGTLVIMAPCTGLGMGSAGQFAQAWGYVVNQ